MEAKNKTGFNAFYLDLFRETWVYHKGRKPLNLERECDSIIRSHIEFNERIRTNWNYVMRL